MAIHAHSTPTPEPTRRTIFGAAALLALAVPARAADEGIFITKMPSPDADLIALAASITAGNDELEAIWDRHCADTEDTETPEEKARIRYLVDLGHEQAEELAELRATTMDGFRAKAQALMRYSGYGEVALAARNQWWSNNDELLGWSLARDLLAGVA